MDESGSDIYVDWVVPTNPWSHSSGSVPKSVYTLLDGFKERGYRIPNMSYLSVDQNFKNIAEMEDTGIDITATDEIGQITKWIGDNHQDPFAFWYHWRFAHLPYNPPDHKRVSPRQIILSKHHLSELKT